MAADLPITVRQKLQQIGDAFKVIQQAVKGDNRDEIRLAWREFGRLIQSVDADSLTGHAKRVWKELSMLLGNDAVDMKLLTDPAAHTAWMRELTNLQKITDSLATAEDVKAHREHFESLSGVTQVLAMSFGFGETIPVYQHHCPMAFGNKGAIWLQADAASKNPYLGSTMLKCADRVERLSPELKAEIPK